MDGRWELAPAYDVCHAYRPGSEWVSQHALSVNGKRADITKSDLETVGESIRCKRASDIIDEINTVVSRWKRYANAVGVNRRLRDQIAETLLDLR
jgi:serine/threonine-protein kinase HipA